MTMVGGVASVRIDRRSEPSADWDDFAQQQTGVTAFHRAAWLRSVKQALGHRVIALEARTPDGALVGVLPLAQVKSALFGNFLMSVPFASYGGPLGSAEVSQQLADESIAIGRELGCSLLELRGRAPLPLSLEVSTRKLTVVLPLDGGADAVFKRFDSKLRSQVRRSEREGATVRFGAELLDDFYAVFSQHMRDLGTPSLGREFFKALSTHYGDDMVIAVAYLGDRPIACGAGFFGGGEFEITWASALREFKKISPNMALYWRLMEHVINRGAQAFNFGRCSDGSNTHKFKRQWGGHDELLYWYQWHPGTTPATTPSPGGGYSAAEAIWQRLPVRVTRLLGPHLARLLP